MKTVKWLYALFFALTFTLAVEMTGAFAVKGGMDYFKSLTLPVFTISGTSHSAIWCIIYIIEAYVIAQLLVANKIKPFIWNYLSIKLLSALWTVCFFAFNHPLLCLVIITVILTFNFLYAKDLFKAHVHPLKNALFVPVLLWYCYLWILNYCIVIMN